MRKHLIRYIARCALLAGVAAGTTSCADLFDMPEAVVPTTMTLETHEVTLMVGDSCVVHPIFNPDTVTNEVIFWMSLNPDVAAFVSADTLVGMSVGETGAVAISVTDRSQIDTCAVNVIDHWALPEEDFPHETIVYANVLIHGAPPADGDVIAAFVGGEVRGIGQMFEMRGHSVMRIRIAGDFVEPDEMEQQSVAFRVYSRSRHQLETFPQWIYFDGETHGTPSQPLLLQIQ